MKQTIYDNFFTVVDPVNKKDNDIKPNELEIQRLLNEKIANYKFNQWKQEKGLPDVTWMNPFKVYNQIK